jgi:hypothetical protein
MGRDGGFHRKSFCLGREMKKDREFRVVFGTCLCGLFASLVWWRAEWSAAQIGSGVVMLLAGGALLVNNRRNEAFHDAAFVPLAAAGVVWFWIPTRNVIEGIINFLVSTYLAWFAMKPYYIKWKNSHSHADGAAELPVGLEGKSNG